MSSTTNQLNYSNDSFHHAAIVLRGVRLWQINSYDISYILCSLLDLRGESESNMLRFTAL